MRVPYKVNDVVIITNNDIYEPHYIVWRMDKDWLRGLQQKSIEWIYPYCLFTDLAALLLCVEDVTPRRLR